MGVKGQELGIANYEFRIRDKGNLYLVIQFVIHHSEFIILRRAWFAEPVGFLMHEDDAAELKDHAKHLPDTQRLTEK